MSPALSICSGARRINHGLAPCFGLPVLARRGNFAGLPSSIGLFPRHDLLSTAFASFLLLLRDSWQIAGRNCASSVCPARNEMLPEAAARSAPGLTDRS